VHRLAFIAALDLHLPRKVALLRFFGPLGGWLTLAWIAAVSALMLAGMIGRPLLRETSSLSVCAR
jgi:hypothetical protein